MKKRTLLISSCLALLVIATAGTMTDSGRAGKTDSPGEGNCSGCHNNTTANTGPGSVSISTNIPNDTYTPGQNYTISVTVSEAARTIFGFGMEALDASNANAGTLVVTNAETQLMTAGNGRINMVHTLNAGATLGTKTFTYDWTAPATDIGYVKFYVGSIAGVPDADPATDNTYTTFKSISSPTVTAVQEAPVQVAGIYPNPVKDALHISLAHVQGNTTLKAELYSLTGQKIADLASQDVHHDLTLELPVPASVSNGMYLLKLYYGNESSCHKILVQR